MRKEDTVRLNCHAAARRIEALDVKQWWLARMIGVDRKTVSRWLTGKVKRIARENARRLAEHLGCDVREITVTDEADVLATKEEQRSAARLLQEQDLLALLAPTDNFELAERLIKATLMPDLPLRDLGRLENLLSIAAWRQGKYDEGRDHADRALEIATRTGDRGIEWRAVLNRATISSLCGSPRRAIEDYERCLESPEHFESEQDRAGALTNLAMTCREAARLSESLDHQRTSIRLFEALDLPFNLAIAWTGLAIIEIELGRFEEALDALSRAEAQAERAGYEKGRATAEVYRADALSLAGDPASAIPILEAGLAALERFEVRDLGCEEVAMRVLRRAGDVAAARDRFDVARGRTPEFPVLHGLLLLERARLAKTEGDDAGEAAFRIEANEVFTALDLPDRVRDRPVVEYGAMFPAQRPR